MEVARKCHTEMRQKTERVITFIKLDDYADRAGRLTGAIASIEGKFGKPVKKTNPFTVMRPAREPRKAFRILP